MDLKSVIRTIPDYPKPGIMFRDVTTLIGDARAFRVAVDQMVQPWAGAKIDRVAGTEALRSAEKIQGGHCTVDASAAAAAALAEEHHGNHVVVLEDGLPRDQKDGRARPLRGRGRGLAGLLRADGPRVRAAPRVERRGRFRRDPAVATHRP